MILDLSSFEVIPKANGISSANLIKKSELSAYGMKNYSFFVSKIENTFERCVD